MPLNMIVCVKQVPDPETPPSSFRVDEAANKVVPAAGVQPVISQFDAIAVKKLGEFDVILCGRQAVDWDMGVTGSAMAEILGLPIVTIAKGVEHKDGKLVVERVLSDG